MSSNDSATPSFHQIKSLFESSSNNTQNYRKPEGLVARRTGLYEKAKTSTIFSSSRCRPKPPLLPKPKDLLRNHKPPVPAHRNSRSLSVEHSPPPLLSPPLSATSTLPVSSNVHQFFGNHESIMINHNTQRMNGHVTPPRESVLSGDSSLSPSPGDCSSPEESIYEGNEEKDELEEDNNLFGHLSKSNTVHTEVINDMIRRGLFDQLKELKDGGLNAETKNDEGLKIEVIPPEIPPHAEKKIDFDKYARENPEIINKLVELETFVIEVCQKEEYFIKLLNLLCIKYPEYLKQCDEGTNSNVYGKCQNVVNMMVTGLKPVLNAHEELYARMKEVALNWDSRKPNFAGPFIGRVELLLLCITFLENKNDICSQFNKLLETTPEFAHATRQFERQVLHHPSINDSEFHDHPLATKPLQGVSTITFIQQMDIIHQNIVRYKLFMDRYKKMIPADSEEMRKTEQVIKSVNKVVCTVNDKIGQQESLLFLGELQTSLEKKFNVLMPGRKFIKDGVVLRQTRKDLSERRLILFNDTLLLCHLDLDTIHKIDLIDMKIEVEDNVERDNWFLIYSPQKSTAIMCEKRELRDSWVSSILQAQEHAKHVNSRPRIGHESFLNIEKKGSYSALWITDDDASMCMMKECSRSFNILVRRHHCRNCGYVICNGCSGYAPVPSVRYESDRVCAACYDELQNKYAMGKLIPNEMLIWNGTKLPVPYPVNSSEPKVKLKSGKITKIKDLFTPPKHGFKTRMTYPDKHIWASGTICSLSSYGKTCYGRLMPDMCLYIYLARYDPNYIQSRNLAGCNYSISDGKDGKVNFKLTQSTGQFVLEFTVQGKSSGMWEDALKKLNSKSE